MSQRKATNKREQIKLAAFVKKLCNAVQSSTSIAKTHLTGLDSTANFIKKHPQSNALVVFLGPKEGPYDVVHSVIVYPNTSHFLVDSKVGSFERGVYNADTAGAHYSYAQYLVLPVDAIFDLSGKQGEDFDEDFDDLMANGQATINNATIPPLGQVAINLSKK